MKAESIIATLDMIAATKSTGGKGEMLRRHGGNRDMERVCLYAYDPFRTYGVRRLPVSKVCDGFKDFDDTTWNLLDRLAARTLTGAAAQQEIALEIDCLIEEGAELLRRILRKDLRAGFGVGAINGAFRSLIKEFPYMRCSLPAKVALSTWPWEQGVMSQEKADGMFANVDHEASGFVSIRTRNGNEFPMEKFVPLVAEIAEFTARGYQMHGEFLVLRDGKVCSRQDGNGVMNHVLKGGDFKPNEQPLYVVWDQVPLGVIVPGGVCRTCYAKRFDGICYQLGAGRTFIKSIPSKVVYSLAEANMHAVEFMRAGKEGSVIKRLDAPWFDGTSTDQVKLKLAFEVDLEIVGFVPGRAGTRNEGLIGSVTCATSDGKLFVDVTVKNEEMRASLDFSKGEWLGAIMTVIANDITSPSESNALHSLFLPRFAEAVARNDKFEADTLERVIEQKDAAIHGANLLKGSK